MASGLASDTWGLSPPHVYSHHGDPDARTRKLAALFLLLAALLAATSAQAEPALWVVKGPHATV